MPRATAASVFTLVLAILTVSAAQQDLHVINDLLLHQLSFLQNENARLLQILQVSVAVLAFAGVTSIWAAYRQYRSTLEQIKADVSVDVDKKVRAHVDQSVAGQVAYLERVIERENVVDRTSIAYCTEGGDHIPSEYSLLEARGFPDPRHYFDLGAFHRTADVLILDVRKSSMDDNQLLDLFLAARDSIKPTAVIVIYVGRYIKTIETFGEEFEHYLTANMPVSLSAAAVDAAHFADHLGRREKLVD